MVFRLASSLRCPLSESELKNRLAQLITDAAHPSNTAAWLNGQLKATHFTATSSTRKAMQLHIKGHWQAERDHTWLHLHCSLASRNYNWIRMWGALGALATVGLIAVRYLYFLPLLFLGFAVPFAGVFAVYVADYRFAKKANNYLAIFEEVLCKKEKNAFR